MIFVRPYWRNTLIEIGDIVETCTLMPGVVRSVDGGYITVEEHDTRLINSHSIKNCDIVKLNGMQAFERLIDEEYEKYR